jgi:F-type H+-transporting ATPase subunit delta
MQEGTIGRRYARALSLSLEGVGEDRLTKIEEQLSAIGAALDRRTGNASLREAMFNPSFSAEQRDKVIEGIATSHQFDAATTSFLRLLVDKDRMTHVQSIALSFRSEVDARIGRVRATICTAKALSAADLAAIVAGLEKKTGKKVVPDVEVDPSLIAGVQARVGGLIYDATVKTQLERLRTEFNIQ